MTKEEAQKRIVPLKERLSIHQKKKCTCTNPASCKDYQNGLRTDIMYIAKQVR